MDTINFKKGVTTPKETLEELEQFAHDSGMEMNVALVSAIQTFLAINEAISMGGKMYFEIDGEAYEFSGSFVKE